MRGEGWGGEEGGSEGRLTHQSALRAGRGQGDEDEVRERGLGVER